MGVIRYKIWYDLWENKGRTARVVAIIAIGAFAVGTTIGGKEFFSQDLTRTWERSRPATVGLTVSPAVDEETITALEHIPGVERAIGWSQATIRWRLTPDAPWQPAFLVAVDDYHQQEIRQIFLDHGAWPRRKLMGVQRGYSLKAGMLVYLEIENKSYPVELNGQLYNAAQPPIHISPEPTFYTTRERFEQLTGEPNSSLLLATVAPYSPALAQAAADAIQRDLEKLGAEVTPALPAPGGFKVRIGHPNRFVAQDVIDSVFLVMTSLAVLSVILGLFLVYNTINALISQQIGQIGIMKAIGARFEQIVGIYMGEVLIYALLALALALPLGALGAQEIRTLLTGALNMIPGPLQLSPTAMLAQTGVVLVGPLLSALLPIWAGARLTVREAISSYGLTGAMGRFGQWLARLEFLPRIVTLTLNNTFRNKQRVALTQITLVGAGAIFMMVMSTRASLAYTFSELLFSIFEVNVMLDLEDEARIQSLEAIARAEPEVKHVEVWGAAKATLRPAGQPATNDDPSANLRGLPPESAIYRPAIRAGRWLAARDTYAAVLNQALAAEAGVGVGDWITLDIPLQGETAWQVVGLLFEPLDPEVIYLPRDTLLREIGQVGQGRAIKIQTTANDAPSEAYSADKLRASYEAAGYDLLASRQDTAHRLATELIGRMFILIYLLTSMSMLFALVGGVALSGTLSINVLERTREIGVMRAIGASSAVIAGQFVGEGLILGWLSWLISLPLSIPFGLSMTHFLSGILKLEIVYRYSATGALYWWGIITVLAVIASWFPAQQAAQTSTYESLNYA
jgi:putative ABC transport system permease protein